MPGEKRWRWAIYTPSFRLLMVRKPWAFSSVIILDCMIVLNISHHTCHFPEGVQQTAPMPITDSSVELINVEGFGLISISYVGIAASDATRCRHKVSSVWNGVDSCIRQPRVCVLESGEHACLPR